jgi:molybdopterin biosynthesis enzyme
VFDAAGRLLVTPVADQDSGLQANLAKAQLLIRRLPRAEAVEPGAMVEVLELTGT